MKRKKQWKLEKIKVKIGAGNVNKKFNFKEIMMEILPLHNTFILLDCVSTLIIQQKERFNNSNNNDI